MRIVLQIVRMKTNLYDSMRKNTELMMEKRNYLLGLRAYCADREKTAEVLSKIEKVKKIKKLLTFFAGCVKLTRQSRLTETSAGSNGVLAQLGEHLPYKQRVIGSSPIGPIHMKIHMVMAE